MNRAEFLYRQTPLHCYRERFVSSLDLSMESPIPGGYVDRRISSDDPRVGVGCLKIESRASASIRSHRGTRGH